MFLLKVIFITQRHEFTDQIIMLIGLIGPKGKIHLKTHTVSQNRHCDLRQSIHRFGWDLRRFAWFHLGQRRPAHRG